MTAPSLCGARRKNGKPCRRPAGWGTGHPGFGQCKLHGGSTRHGEKAGARLIAEAEARKLANAATPIKVDPTEALLMALYSAVALTEAARSQFATLLDADAATQTAIDAAHVTYTRALDRQQSYAESAVRLGIQTKQVELIERTGETILTLLRDVLADLEVPMSQALPILTRRLRALGPGIADQVDTIETA